MTTPVPLYLDTEFKDAIVRRLESLVETEVRDYLNCTSELEGDAYKDELTSMLSYLDDNLSIFIK